MFRRDTPIVAVPDGREEQPALTTEQLRKRQASVLERRLNTPSTFASRQASAIPPRRVLVSMGTCERTFATNTRGDVAVGVFELYFEKERPSRRWYRMIPHGDLQPMFDDSTVAERTTPLGEFSASRRPDGAYNPSPPDPPARPV